MNPRCRSLWITPAHSGALAPARNVHARDSSSPVVRNVRRPSKWYAACATVLERRLADAVHLAHLGAVLGRARRDLGLDVDRHRELAPAIARVGLGVDFSPVFSTTSIGLVVSRNTGASRARSPASSVGAAERRAVGERRVRPFERRDLGHDLLVAALGGAALAVEPLLDARRCRP